MIHYDRLAKKFEELQPGELLILEVSGMLPVGRFREGHEREGEAIPPKIANGTLVKVVETDVDAVKVATEDGKTEVVFSHSIGASRLAVSKLKAFPKAEPPK